MMWRPGWESVGYTWHTGGDNVYVCDNSTNSGKYAYNNLQADYATWCHKINDSWHTATESWYMWEKNVPNANNPNASTLLITGANGAICNSASELACHAPEWAIVNYPVKQFSAKDYLTIRNEYFNDIKGQRTGFRTQYSEHLLGWGHWIGTTVLFRPELRFEHAYDAAAYNAGTKKSQLVFASDVIFHFRGFSRYVADCPLTPFGSQNTVTTHPETLPFSAGGISRNAREREREPSAKWCVAGMTASGPCKCKRPGW